MRPVRQCAWHLFVKSKFKEPTYANTPGHQALKRIAPEWRALSPEKRAEWVALAAATAPVVKPQKVTCSREQRRIQKKITPFFGYSMAMRPKLAAEGYRIAGRATIGAVAKKIAESWRAMPESEKAEWNVKAKELTEKRWAAIKAGTHVVKRQRGYIINPFAMFLKEKRMALFKEGMKNPQICSVLGQQWRAMDASEKAQWAERAAQLTRERREACIPE